MILVNPTGTWKYLALFFFLSVPRRPREGSDMGWDLMISVGMDAERDRVIEFAGDRALAVS